jgi:hypothetical protein
LIDVSCLGESNYEALVTEALSIWNQSDEKDGNRFLRDDGLAQHRQLQSGSAGYLGEHFFVGKIPRWDFSVPGGLLEENKEAFVLGAQPAAANVAAPVSTGEGNIAWLYLNRQDGELANEIYRTDTRGGVAPQSVSVSTKSVAGEKLMITFSLVLRF